MSDKKLALLIGNRFNPWHLRAYALLDGFEPVAFRADSEIQRYFLEQGGSAFSLPTTPIYFDAHAGALRLFRRMQERFLRRPPRILPFAERLEGFDRIQTWELSTDWTAEALKARHRYHIPVAVMVWDNIAFNMERTPLLRARKQRALAEADAFIVQSERSHRMLLLEGAPESKVHFIEPGVDTDSFCPGPRERIALGWKEEEFVILFIGWFLPRKGLDFLLLALRELLNDADLKSMPLRLVMVGSGPGRERIEALIARLELGAHCTFTGSVPYERMPQCFRSSDVFVLPSIATPEWQEQFGMSLIEAMSCGVPAVSTWSGSIPEIAGDCALLCQPNDFVSLYAALKTLMLDPGHRAALGIAGRARALEHFRLTRLAADLTEIHNHLMY